MNKRFGKKLIRIWVTEDEEDILVTNLFLNSDPSKENIYRILKDAWERKDIC